MARSSKTCGIRLRKRKRKCSNPYHGQNGNACFWNYTECIYLFIYLFIIVIICFNNNPKYSLHLFLILILIDGDWSRWTSWSMCTASCNGGLMTRDRNCNNPKPSSIGSYCNGFNRDSKLCNTEKCPGINFNLNIYMY